MGQVWCLAVTIPDLRPLSYFKHLDYAFVSRIFDKTARVKKNGISVHIWSIIVEVVK